MRTESPGETIWLNGRFLPLELARISPWDRGFLYGDGCFETIRSDAGRPLYLRQHLERLHRSLADFRIIPESLPDWPRVIDTLLRDNGLDNGAASIKIMVTRGVAPPLGMPVAEHPTVCVLAREYIPPQDVVYEKGINLYLYDEGYAPPLAPHKSLNYLYFLAARQAALDNGASDAILLDKEERVTETSSGSLLAMTNGEWWTPGGKYRLPGITIREISRILMEMGTVITERLARPRDLMEAETVWVLNSLIGVMPVSGIGIQRIAQLRAPEAAHLRRLLFERGR